MKVNLNTLVELGKEIDLSMFYSIRISESEIRLQGDLSEDCKDELLKQNFMVNNDELLACDLVRGNIHIVIL